ncbi:MAG: hypothetical protein OHK0052_10310 [Anaerolineales bacterium]
MPTAFVIDDNRPMADSLCQMLNLLGITAYPLYGSRSALSTMVSRKPDIVFLDVNMPGITGFDVLSFMQREPSLTGVPVVMVTSDDQPQTAERAKQTGALLTLIKPVDFDDLEKLLIRLGLNNPKTGR